MRFKFFSLRTYLRQNMALIWISFLFIAALFIRFSAGIWSFSSGDFRSFLKPWMQEIVDNGGWSSLGKTIGNYPVSYMLILTFITSVSAKWMEAIKMVSVLFDVGMAVASYVLVSELLRGKPSQKATSILAFGIVFLLPTVILNGAMWAQSDSLYTFFILVTLILIAKQKYVSSMVVFGLAFAFKLQAIFLLPFLALMYLLNNRYRAWHFSLILAVYVVISFPAVLWGRSWLDILMIYIYQTGTYQSLTLNFPSLYALFPSRFEIFGLWGFVVFAITMMGVAWAAIQHHWVIKKALVLDVAVWTIVVTVFLLPSMHERYMYAADVLSISYALVKGKRWYVPLMINGLSLLAYYPYLFSTTVVEMKYLALAFVVFLAFFTKDLIHDVKESMADSSLETA